MTRASSTATTPSTRSCRSSGSSRRRSRRATTGPGIAYEALIDGATHGLRYRETFFTPPAIQAGGQDLGEIVAGLTEGIEAAEAEATVRCRLIADMDRAYGPSAGLELVEQVGEPGGGQADRIIGIGADLTELGIDISAFAPAFEAARRLGLRRTFHAGEAVAPDLENIRSRSTRSALSASTTASRSPRTRHWMRRVADDGVPLTVCPTSNVIIANRYRPRRAPARGQGGRPASSDDHHRRSGDGGHRHRREYRRVAAAYDLDVTMMGRLRS